MSPCLMTTLVELSVFQAKDTLPRDIRVRVKVGKDSDRSRRGLAAADFFVAFLSVQQMSNLPTLTTFLPSVKKISANCVMCERHILCKFDFAIVQVVQMDLRNECSKNYV